MKLPCLIFVLSLLLYTTSASGQFKLVKIPGAVLNYLDQGTGTPIVFIHGGLEDYRTWDPQIDSFSKRYRVITYSRRFNFPNHNLNAVVNYSAQTEADDLASMIVNLKLPPVHLVGHSFGGLTALCFAVKYPQLVRSLTLSEPPVISWVAELPNGKGLRDDFYDRLQRPLREDFANNDTTAILRHTLIYFYGSDVSNELPVEVRTAFLVNLPEWRAMFTSPNAFPEVDKKRVQEFKMPVLLLSAGKTMPLLQLTNSELQRLLPQAKTFQLAEGTHDYWVNNPVEMGEALMRFVESVDLVK